MILDYLQTKKDVSEILNAHNLPKNQADIVADCFVTADAGGVYTHGISMLASHIKKIDNGEYNLYPKFEKEKSTHSFCRINCDNAIGAFSAYKCMMTAVNNAKNEGIYTVFANNCNTYGAAFYYTKYASDNGMIGITFCNSPAAMAPWGSYEKLIGTNPFAVSIPSKSRGSILFDMATSKVAKSKINQARINGSEIPDGWALDVNGKPTTNPIEAIKGVVLPMAEHKGYGLALSIDIIAGMLSGAQYSTGIGKFYSVDGKAMNVGQVFIAINPEIVMNRDFYSLMDDYIDKIHNCQPLENQTVYYPGERKQLNIKKAMDVGIDYDNITINMLDELKSLGE